MRPLELLYCMVLLQLLLPAAEVQQLAVPESALLAAAAPVAC